MSDRLMTWLILISAVSVIGVLVYRAHMDEPTIDTTVAPIEKTSDRVTALRTKMTDCQRIGEKIRVDGYVTNRGTTTLNSVLVQSIWKDKAGQIIDTGTVYAVTENAPLPPEETREFSDTTTLRNVASCNVRAVDWWASDG